MSLLWLTLRSSTALPSWIIESFSWPTEDHPRCGFGRAGCAALFLCSMGMAKKRALCQPKSAVSVHLRQRGSWRFVHGPMRRHLPRHGPGCDGSLSWRTHTRTGLHIMPHRNWICSLLYHFHIVQNRVSGSKSWCAALVRQLMVRHAYATRAVVILNLIDYRCEGRDRISCMLTTDLL